MPIRHFLLTTIEAAEYLRLKKHTLENMRWQGTGPPFRKHGGACSIIAPNSNSGPTRRAAVPRPGKRRDMRRQPLFAAGAAVALLSASHVLSRGPVLVWNASPSVPTGLYRIVRTTPAVGDLVLVRLPPRYAALAATTGLSAALRLPCQTLVATGATRSVDAAPRSSCAGSLLHVPERAMQAARPLPSWQGCRVLQAGELFVLADDPDSFDSRYFGALPPVQWSVVPRVSGDPTRQSRPMPCKLPQMGCMNKIKSCLPQP